MKTSSLLLALFLSIAAVAATDTAPNFWKANPVDGNWQNNSNWSLGFGGGDATFGVSAITDIYNQSGFGSIVFAPGASAYTIKPFSNPVVTGGSITNNSSVIQNFETTSFQGYFFYGDFTIGSRIVFTLNSYTAADFFDTASAGEATFVGRVATGMVFSDNSTAGNAVVTLEGGVGGGAYALFEENASAGNANFTAQGDFAGGFVEFDDDSSGGTARIKLSGTGHLRVFYHKRPGLTVGSIEGDGLVELGNSILSNNLNLGVGTNDLNTTFSGLINDSGAGGSLTKLGKGTFTLASANTYTGGTLVRKGQLLANNTTGSATGSGPVQVAAGLFGGKGIVTGAVTIGTGGSNSASLAPGAKATGLLTIENTLEFGPNGIYRWDLTSDSAQSDQVVAAGLTIAAGARFRSADRGTAGLPAGKVFTAINNTAATPIIGTFSDLVDGAIVTVNGNNLQASYSGGDGNDLTLTVVP
jgi:autotransporter-associated beta strand protein